MNIKPIETVFDGHRFRSRLEARWAVYFKELGVPYEYELEGYQLADGSRYLPDFFLPTIGLHVEVKPNQDISRKDLEKIIKFAVDAEQKLLLIVGTPSTEAMYLVDRRCSDGWCSFEPMEAESSHEDQLESLFETLHDWSMVEFGAVPLRSGISLVYTLKDPQLHYALAGATLKAKQARFEHGRSGN